VAGSGKVERLLKRSRLYICLIRRVRVGRISGRLCLFWKQEESSRTVLHGRERTALHAAEGAASLLVAVGGPSSAEMAGRAGDGFIATIPEGDLIEMFDKAGGRGKPRYGSLTVCWAKDEKSARRTAHRIWPTVAMESSLSWELPLPKHFEDVAELVTEDPVAEEFVCGQDPERHVAAIIKYVKAGFDHVGVHQVGPDQEGFFRFYAAEVLPRLALVRTAA
jgi:G6PDH family F420-dependent oxidoreductase